MHFLKKRERILRFQQKEEFDVTSILIVEFTIKNWCCSSTPLEKKISDEVHFVGTWLTIQLNSLIGPAIYHQMFDACAFGDTFGWLELKSISWTNLSSQSEVCLGCIQDVAF